MSPRFLLLLGTLLFAGGFSCGWGLGQVFCARAFPPKSPAPLHAPTPEETLLYRRRDLAKLGSLKSSEVVIYADLQAFDELDERGSLTVPAGTYATVKNYHPWNDSVRVRIETGPVKGREGITLRTNLRKLSR